MIGKTGFSISYASENHYQKAINLAVDANAADFGIELDGKAQINVGVDLGIDFDLSFDWQNFSTKFDLNKLAFQATAAATDIKLGAYFGPLAMSIGSDEIGKQKGTAAITVGGSLSYVNDKLNVTTNNNRIDVMLPFYGSLGGYEFGNGFTPKVYLEGQIFNGSGLTFRTENFDKLLNFRNFGVADAIGMVKDIISWAKDYRQSDFMNIGIPFTELSVGSALDFATTINDNVLSKIDLYRPVVNIFTGSNGVLSGGQLTQTGQTFDSTWKGKVVTIQGLGDFNILQVENNTLTLENASTISQTALNFSVHNKKEQIRTYQELIVAVNNSGILPVNVPMSYDPIQNAIIMPFSFRQDLPVLNNVALDLGLDLGELSLSTNAKTSLRASVDGRMDLVIDFDGPTGTEPINLYIDNVELNGTASFDVSDLEVAAKLGFLGLTAGGAGTGSGVHLAASISTGLDRDRQNNTPGDRRFGFNDLINGDLMDSFYLDIDGEGSAKLKGLKVNGGFGNISIAPNLELGVYAPNLLNLSGFQTVKQPVTESFDLQAQIASGAIQDKGIIVVIPNLSSIFDLKNLSFEQIMQGIQMGVDFLQESLADQPFYTTPIPVINTSLQESFTFLNDLTSKLELAAANPAGVLQEVELTIENALGLVDNNSLAADQQLFSLSLSDHYLNIHLGWQALFSQQFDFNLDLKTLKELSGNALAPALDAIDYLVDINGGGNVLFEALANLSFDVGIDINTLTTSQPDIFLRDYDPMTSKGTHAQIGARLEGKNLNLGFQVGPLEIAVDQASLVLDADGNVNTKDYAGLLVAIDQKATSTKPDDGLYHILTESLTDNLSVKLLGGFDINLPITLSILGLDFNLDPIHIQTNPAYGDQGLVQLFKHLAKSADAGIEKPLKMSFPDIRGQFASLGGNFSLLALINDPSFILNGVDSAVGTLEDVLNSGLAQDIPLVGEKLATAASFLRDMRTGVLADLRAKLSGNGKAIEYIRETLWNILGPSKLNLLLDANNDGQLNINDVQINWFNASGQKLQTWHQGDILPTGVDSIQFDMKMGGHIYGTGIDLPLDFQLPGFSLDVNGGFGLDIGWGFDFGFGLSLQDSFYLAASNDTTKPELHLDVSAFLDGTPTDPNVTTPFSAQGKLLFFKASLVDQNPNGKASGVYGQLGLDLLGDARGRLTLDRIFSGSLSKTINLKFGVNANLDLGMTLELDGAKGLPRLGGDFQASWNWELGKKALAPTVGIKNLRIDVGSFVTDFLTPIASNIKSALEPVRPLIEVLQTKIPGLDMLIPDNTVKGLINIVLLLKGRKPIDWAFVDEAQQMLNFVDKLATLQSTGWLPLGDIVGLGTKNVQGIAASNQNIPADIDNFLNQNTRTQPSTANQKFSKVPRSGFQVLPYIKDIGNWTQILTGGDATLFTYEMPILKFEADFSILLATIPLPPSPVDIKIRAVGAFGASVDLGFGYDTYGIRQAINSGNPLDAFDGFFIMDYALEKDAKGRLKLGKEKDELTLKASLGIAAALSLGIFSVGLQGNITMTMGVDLQDIKKPTLYKNNEGYVTNQTWEGDGKIRISEMMTMWNYQGGGPKNLVNLTGAINLSASAFVELDLGISTIRALDLQIFDIELIKLTYNAPNVEPVLGEVRNGVLYLNMGSSASQRVYKNQDGGEIFTLDDQYGAGTVNVEYEGYYQSYSGVTSVVADGGEGNDTIDASRLKYATVNLKGGKGKDKLIAGWKGGILDGGEGDDVLDASLAIDIVTLIGGDGNDKLTGGTGNDILIGGAGDDRLSSGTGNDTLEGGEGTDNLSGGEGNDTYMFADVFGLDRFSDSVGANIFDFTKATQNINFTVGRRGISADQGGGANAVKANGTAVVKLRLGRGNDLVNISDFADRTIDIEDIGGDDTYRVRMGRSQATLADGVINLNDSSGAFDEVIFEQTMNTSIALNQNQVKNGREIFNYNSDVDRLTFLGKAAQFNRGTVLDFGGNVSFNNTDNNLISRLGRTDLRVIANSVDFQSQINSDAIIVDSFQTVIVPKILNAVNNGYIDLRTYRDLTDIKLSADLKVSSANNEDAQGSGWIRLTAADGSLINTNASDILGSNSHLIVKVKNQIGTVAAPILTDIGALTAATALHGQGDIVIQEKDSLNLLSNGDETPVQENPGLILPNLPKNPIWVTNSNWISQLTSDWRDQILDGANQYAVANGNGNIAITLLAQDSRLSLLSGEITGRTAGANIVLTADDMNFRTGANQVNGVGNLTLQANQLAWNYMLGGAAENRSGQDLNDIGIDNPNVFELSNLDLGAIAGDFDTVTIGRTNPDNIMEIGDLFYGTTGKFVPDVARPLQAQQPEFRNTTTLKTDYLHIRGDVHATGEILTIETRNALIDSQNIHNTFGSTDSGVTAANLTFNVKEQMAVSGWLRATENLKINVYGSTGIGAMGTYEGEGPNSLRTNIGSEIAVLLADGLVDIDTVGSIKMAGLVDAKGANSTAKIYSDTVIQHLEGSIVQAKDRDGQIRIEAGQVILMDPGSAVIAGARFEDVDGKPTAIKTSEGADVTMISPHELVIKGTVTTADQMNLTAGSPLNHYNGSYFSLLPKDQHGNNHYLTAIGEDQFGMLITGTLTSLADNTTLTLATQDDIIIRGNINVFGQNSNLKISTPTWAYIESILDVKNNIDILGGFNLLGTSTNGANTAGSSVYIHGTSRINSKQAGSKINIKGAQDVDIFGAVVAGGVIGENGVTFAQDSTVNVTAGQQIYLDTGLLASKSVVINGGAAGADDNGLGLIVTPAGGATALGFTSDNSGALISMNNQGNMEMMGTLVSGGKLNQTFDANGNMLSQTIDWSGEYGKILINSVGQAFIGGNTVNQQGEAIQTGGYLYAGDRIEINGGGNSSGTGAYIQAASELVTHTADSSIEINAAQDVDIQGLLLPGGQIQAVRDANGKYLGRYVTNYGGNSTIKVTAQNQVRIGQILRAGKQIDLIGGIDPVETGVANSGKGMVLYGSTQLETWREDSQINLDAPGRIDILAPAHTNEIEAAGFYELATGVVSQDITLKLRIDKVNFVMEATVTLPKSVTANNTNISDLLADLNNTIKAATWTVVNTQDSTVNPIGSTYTGFDQYDMTVKLRDGRLMLTSSYATTLLKNGSINANLLGFTNLTTNLTSNLPYAVKAGEIGSQVTIGSPTRPNGKLYIAGKVLGYEAINLNSGTSPDGIDIDLDYTGLLETRDGSIVLDIGAYGIVKGDVIAGGTGSDVVITADNTIELYGSLTAEDQVRLSAGTTIAAGQTTVHTFGTSKIEGRLVNITGLNDVIIDSTIGEGSVGMTNIDIAATYGDLTLARTSGRIITDADLTLTGKNISVEGVLRHTQGDANANTTEVLIDATNNVTLNTDIISQGTVKIKAVNQIQGYNGQVLVQGTGEVLNLNQTNADGNISFGRTILVNGKYQQQGFDLQGIANLTVNSGGTVNIGSGVRLLNSADNSNIDMTANVINVIGSLLAGATLNNNNVTWTGKTANVNLTAADVVTFGGAGADNVTGAMVTRGGSAQATGNVNITVNGGANLLDFSMNSLSSIQSDARAAFSEIGTPVFSDITDSSINLTAQGQVEIDGLMQTYDNNADMTIDSAGLLLINGYLKAEDTLTVDGGTSSQAYGLMLTPLIYQDPQGRFVNSTGFYINANGEYVDANGVKLALNAAPIASSEAAANLTRVSGGTLDTAANGFINISAESGIVLSGQVAPFNGTTVNPEKVTIISENNAGDVFIDNAVGAKSQIIIKGRNLYLVDYRETNPQASILPNNALIQTYGSGNLTLTDPAIQIQGTGEVIIAKSQAPLTRALVDSHKDIEVIANKLWIQGYLASRGNSDISLNVVGDATINGLVTADRNLNLRTGINPNWSLNTLRGTITRSQLNGGNVLLNGTGTLTATLGSVSIVAGGTVTVDADVILGDGTKPVPLPFITQKAITVPVVTGTKQISDGTVLVESVNWISTTVTEQVGVDNVRVGSKFYTMDVTLTQDSFWNPTTQTEREYFVNKVDYSVNASGQLIIGGSTYNVNWGSSGKPSVDHVFAGLSDEQRLVIIDKLGYYQLYDFSYTNAKINQTINGNPTVQTWNPSWAGNTTKTIINVPVDGWNNSTDPRQNKYIRVPLGAEADVRNNVLRVVSQGSPTAWNENVGYYWDNANVKYTQDKSALTTYYNNGAWVQDYDNSPIRWQVNYYDGGTRNYSINELNPNINTLSNPISGLRHGQTPDWNADLNFVAGYDNKSAYTYAPSQYFSTTANRAASAYYSSSRNNINVGYDYNNSPAYGWTSTLDTSIDAPNGNWRYPLIMFEHPGQRGGGQWFYVGTHGAAYNNSFSTANFNSYGGLYRATVYDGGSLDGTLYTFTTDVYIDHLDVVGMNDRISSVKVERKTQTGWNGLDLYETQYDYWYNWTSTNTTIYDKRLTLQYQWVSNQEDIYDNRARYETRDIQLKNVSVQTNNKFRTENITEDQTIWVTERQNSNQKLPFGAFANDTIRAANGITIDATGNISIAGKLVANSASSNININSLGDITIQGKLPVGRNASDTLASPSYISAQNLINITGSSVSVLDFSELFANNSTRQVNITSTSSTGDINFAGAINAGTTATAGTQVQLNAGNDLNLVGLLNVGNGVIANAGQVSGIGNITGNNYTFIQTGSNGNINLTAGATTGNIDLPSGWLITGTANLTASQGSINNYKVNNSVFANGLITANTIDIVGKSGISANLKVTNLSVTNSSTGDINLTLDSTSTINATAINTNDGDIDIKSVTGIRLRNATALASGNDINILAGGAVTVDRLQAYNNLDIKAAGALILDLDNNAYLSTGTAMNILAASITRNNTNRVSVPNLSIKSGSAVNLYTQVSNLSLETGSIGDVSIDNNAANLNITTALIGDGNFTLNTSGILTANLIKVINNSQGRNVTLTSVGNLTIGQIDAGNYADYDANGNLVSYSQINLTANGGGDILALNSNDDIAELKAVKANLSATGTGGEIGLLEVDLAEITAFADGNIQIEGIGKIGTTNRALNMPQMTSNTGNILVSNLGSLVASAQLTVAAGTGIIDLNSKQGDLAITVINGDVLLNAQSINLRATQALTIDSSITLDGINVNLNAGDSGVVQGGVKLPTIKTDNLSFEVGSDNIIISPESFAKFTEKTSGSTTTVSLKARGNLQITGTYAGYYKYRDTATQVDYYLDKGDISQSTVYNSALVALTPAEQANVALAPVLNTVQYQLREPQSGKFIYTGNDGREYYADTNLSGNIYSRQINQSGAYLAAGYYAYAVTENIAGQVPVNKIIYSTQSDYTLLKQQNPTYSDVQIYFTKITNASSLNLQAKLQSELAGAIKMSQPAGQLATTQTSFALSADNLILNAQKDLGGLDFQQMIATASYVEITTGDNMVLTGSPVSNNLVLSSLGYYDGANLMGGSISTSSGTVLNSSNINVSALKNINIATNANTLNASVMGSGTITVNETNDLTLNNVIANDGAVTITAGGNLTVRNVTTDTSAVALTANSILSGTEVTDIRANALTLKATAGIATTNNVLQTSVNTLTIAPSSGNIYLDNVGVLTVNNASLTTGSLDLENWGALTVGAVTVNSGNLAISTHGAFTQTGNMSVSGTINLEAGDSAAGDNLTINTGVSISAGGTITLKAGDDLTLNSTATVTTPGTVNIITDQGSTDIGVGGNVNLYGTVNAPTVNITTGDDVDTITLYSNKATTTINAGVGDDIINLGNSSNTLNNFTVAVTVNGGIGANTLNINNQGDTIGRNISLTATTINGVGAGVNYNTVQKINLYLGSGNDNITANSTVTAAIFVDGNGGTDTFGQDFSLRTDDLNLTVDLQNFIPSTIDYANVEQIGLILGSGNDTVTLVNPTLNSNSRFSIVGNGGSDRLDLDFSANTSGFNQSVTVNNTFISGLGLDSRLEYNTIETLAVELGSGADIINLTNNFTGNFEFVTNAGNDSGLGMTGSITYSAETLNINLGSGGDTFTINSTHTGQTNVNSNAGADTVRVKTISGVTNVATGTEDDSIQVFNDSNTVNSISAELTISGDANNDTITVNNTADTTDNIGTLTSTNLSGLGMTGSITYSNTETLNINLGSGGDTFTINSTHTNITNVNSNAGADTVRVKTISGATNVSTGTEDDSIQVFNDSNTVNSISAELTISGDANNDTITVNNTADTTDNIGTLTSTNLSGLGMTGSITYSNTETLDIKLGSGNDTFNVNSTIANVSNLVMINAAAGNDNLQITNINSLNQLVIIGGTGDDSLTVQQSTNTHIILIGDNATIQHSNSWLSQISNNSGNGNDTITLNSGINTVLAGAGNDTITTNPGTTRNIILADNGVASISGGKLTQITSTNNSIGGTDTIQLNGGLENIIISGAGDDQVITGTNRTANDSDIIFTDEANLTVTSDGYDITSINPNNGGNDTVQINDGLITIIVGGIGNDTITTNSGNDLIAGGNARIRRIFTEVWTTLVNFISGTGTDNDIITGGEGNDTLYGQGGNDQLFGEGGNDWLRGDEGADTIDGATGIDRISYDNSSNGTVVNIDSSKGYQGTGGITFNSLMQDTPLVTNLETVFNIAANTAQDGFGSLDTLANLENITGSANNDILIGNALENQIEGLNGDDILIGNAGNDTLEGNDGADTVSYRRDPLAVIANLTTGIATNGFGNTDSLSNIENLIGSAFNDELRGNALKNRIYGGEGNDMIFGADGNDELYGEAGNDKLYGEADNDFLVGGSGITAQITDELHGGDGIDAISYYTANSGVSVSMILGLGSGSGNMGDDFGDFFTKVENLEGSQFNDRLTGDGGANLISGLGRHDTLEGLGGDNSLYGGDGNDILTSTGGNNLMDGGTGINTITNTGNGNTTIYSGAGDDKITTGSGNDTIYAGEGNNVINAGEGNNTIYAGSGWDAITTGAGDDTIQGGDGNNIIDAGNGNNTVTTGAGSDSIYSGTGNDTINGGNGSNTIDAGAGANQITTGSGNDRITTGAGNDVINAGDGSNYITGGDGNNHITGGAGQDDIFTGIGNDTIQGGNGHNNIFTGAGDDRITTGDGIDQIDAGHGNNNIESGAAGDVITTGAGNDVINAGNGNNTIKAGDGNNTVISGSGWDTITTGAGDDTIQGGDGNNIIDAGNGNNTVTTGAGSDSIYSGTGNDTINGGNGSNTIDAGAGANQITTGSGDDRITTGAGNDVINAGDGSNYITGGNGNNHITGGAGRDDIFTGIGNDTIQGGNGDNNIFTGAGDDRITTGDGIDQIDAGDGNNNIESGAAGDVITTGAGNDVINAGNGNNTIKAGDGNNTVISGSGWDTITTGAGDDVIDAGDGSNIINAGDGHNEVTTGSGNDNITTGSGNDVIYYGDGSDVINAGLGINTLKKFRD